MRPLRHFHRLVTTPNDLARAWWAAGTWERLVPVLRAWTHRHTPRYAGITPDDVEDIASKVIVRAWTNTYVPDNPSAWVRLVCTNAARDLGKRALHPARRSPEAFETMPAPDTADAWITTDDEARRHRIVHNAVQALPTAYRDVVQLFFLEGLGHREVGARLGITEGCSRIRVVRAKPLLAQSLAMAT